LNLVWQCTAKEQVRLLAVDAFTFATIGATRNGPMLVDSLMRDWLSTIAEEKDSTRSELLHHLEDAARIGLLTVGAADGEAGSMLV